MTKEIITCLPLTLEEGLAIASSIPLPAPNNSESDLLASENLDFCEPCLEDVPLPIDPNSYNSYEATIGNFLRTRADVYNTLKYLKYTCMHLHQIQYLIQEYGESALKTPPRSPRGLSLVSLLQGEIPHETALELAQHSFAVHHTAISECLRKCTYLPGNLPSYKDFSDQRNWFCHDYGTPEANDGMTWVIDGGIRRKWETGEIFSVTGAKLQYEELLPKVSAAIQELVWILDDDKAWRESVIAKWWEVEKVDKVEIGGKHIEDADGSGCEKSYTNKVQQCSEHDYEGMNKGIEDDIAKDDKENSAKTLDPSSYYHYDGILTRPIRALYFHSRFCRRVFKRISDFTWNRQIEYCRYHGINEDEEIDPITEDWVDKVDEEGNDEEDDDEAWADFKAQLKAKSEAKFARYYLQSSSSANGNPKIDSMDPE